MTQTVEHVQTTTTDVPEDAAHIVPVPPDQPDLSPQAYVLRARIEGFPVTAICGYTWVPEKNPEPLPVCSSCMSEYLKYGDKYGDRDKLPDA